MSDIVVDSLSFGAFPSGSGTDEMVNRSKPNPLLGAASLLLGGAIGYLWKGTFAAFWIGGIVGFLIVGLLWASVPVLLGRGPWRTSMKTFHSERYGFEIDIPDHWCCPPTGFFARLFGFDKNPGFRGEGESLNLEIGPLSPEPSLDETGEAFREYASYVGHSNIRTGAVQLGGSDHFSAVYKVKEGIWLKKYALVFRGVEYAITCCLGPNEQKVVEKEQMYDEIVSTCRLVGGDSRAQRRESSGTRRSRERRAMQLNREGFILVDVGKHEEAKPLLEEAVRLAPESGDCHNELSICYDRLGRTESAKSEAQAAISCDPNNPKFRNGLIAVLLSDARRAKSRQQLTSQITGVHQEIDRLIHIAPGYAPAHLAKAEALALGGAAQGVWQSELEKAARKYGLAGETASGLPAEGLQIACIVENNRGRCEWHCRAE